MRLTVQEYGEHEIELIAAFDRGTGPTVPVLRVYGPPLDLYTLINTITVSVCVKARSTGVCEPKAEQLSRFHFGQLANDPERLPSQIIVSSGERLRLDL